MYRADYVDNNKPEAQSPKLGNQMRNKFQILILRKGGAARGMHRQLPGKV